MFLRYLIFLLYINTALAQYNNLLDVDFIQSLTDGDEGAKELMQKNPNNLKILKEQYDSRKPSLMPYSETPLIPKIMHHVWDGDLNPIYRNYLEECKKIHPDWEFKFWSDKDIRELNLENQDLYDKSRNYAGRSDIARYEILYRFGGVYRDIDVKCYRPIDDLNHKYEFFAPIEFPTKYWQVVLNNGIIGASPNHPILKSTLGFIRANFDERWQRFDRGKEKIVNKISMMVSIASMLPLTDGFIKEYEANPKAIALPASYFWGLSSIKYHTIWATLKYMILGNNFDVSAAFQELRPETLMYHNFTKEEIYSTGFDYANGIYDPQIKRFINSLNNSEKRRLDVFKQVYAEHAPSGLRGVKKSKMPEVLHFIIFDNEELKELHNHLQDWQIRNAAFEFNIWTKDKIFNTFSELNIKIPDTLREQYRFYIALNILQKFGGAYANYSAIPHRPIFDLNNKYNFYAGLMPIINREAHLLFSQKIIGSSPNHIILSKTLEKIKLEDLSTLEDINRTLVTQAYKNIYLYDDIGARNIVFPAGYFEPFAKLEKDSLMDKLTRFIFREERAFSTLPNFAVLQ